MSETVHYKGKLKLVKIVENNEVLEDVYKDLCVKNSISELLDYYESFEEQLRSELYNKYVILDEEKGISIWEILTQKRAEEYEMFNLHKTSDLEADYEVMFYDGCMGLSEAIEESFKRLGE